MTKHLFTWMVSVLLLTGKTQAQVYDQGLVLYVNSVFMSGSNLFNNPLQTGSNDLNSLFPTVPESTSVSLWNSSIQSFDVTSTFTNGAWSSDLLLPPGTGALVLAPSPFTNTTIGSVLDHTGNLITNDDQITNLPPAFTGAPGLYLLGDKCPIADLGTNIFLNLIGRLPIVGEQVILLSGTSTYLGNGLWDSTPTLGVGESAFLNILTEPVEPVLLSIVYVQNRAVIFWPSGASGWTLQTNMDLGAGQWGDYSGPIFNNFLIVSPSPGNVFFRLYHP